MHWRCAKQIGEVLGQHPIEAVEWQTDHIVEIAVDAGDKKGPVVILDAIRPGLVHRRAGGYVPGNLAVVKLGKGHLRGFVVRNGTP